MDEYSNIDYLIKLLISLEDRAWEYFFKNYGGLIYKYINKVIYKYSMKTSQETKKDIFQDIIGLLLEDNCRRLKNIQHREKKYFCSWLRTTVIRYTYRLFFPQKKEEFVTIDDPPFDIPISDHKDKLIFYHELKELISQKLETKESLVLLYLLDGLTLKEIAELMAISIAGVHNYKEKGLSTIREYFKNDKN